MIKRYLKNLFDFWWIYCAVCALGAVVGWILFHMYLDKNPVLFFFTLTSTFAVLGLLFWRYGHMYDAKVRKRYKSGRKIDVMSSAFDAAAFCIPISFICLVVGIVLQFVL